MASESRILPSTNKTREAALDAGKSKNDAMGTSSFITATTVALLVFIQAAYGKAMLLVSATKAVYFKATILKNKNRSNLEMVCSQFIQVFVFGVKRGVFSVADLAYYSLTEGGELPDMSTDAKLLKVAKQLIDGDAKRMLVPGAVVMSMPGIAEVQASKTLFEQSMVAQNNSLQALKDASKACNDLNLQADQCIKLLWGEVELHSINEPRPTMRANARLWGVIYTQVGGTKIITGKITDSVTGEAIVGAEIYFANGNNDSTSDATGYKLDTTLMGVQNMIVSHPLYNDVTTAVTLVEGEDQVVNIVMVAKVV